MMEEKWTYARLSSINRDWVVLASVGEKYRLGCCNGLIVICNNCLLLLSITVVIITVAIKKTAIIRMLKKVEE